MTFDEAALAKLAAMDAAYRGVALRDARHVAILRAPSGTWSAGPVTKGAGITGEPGEYGNGATPDEAVANMMALFRAKSDRALTVLDEVKVKAVDAKAAIEVASKVTAEALADAIKPPNDAFVAPAKKDK